MLYSCSRPILGFDCAYDFQEAYGQVLFTVLVRCRFFRKQSAVLCLRATIRGHQTVHLFSRICICYTTMLNTRPFRAVCSGSDDNSSRVKYEIIIDPVVLSSSFARFWRDCRRSLLFLASIWVFCLLSGQMAADYAETDSESLQQTLSQVPGAVILLTMEMCLFLSVTARWESVAIMQNIFLSAIWEDRRGWLLTSNVLCLL